MLGDRGKDNTFHYINLINLTYIKGTSFSGVMMIFFDLRDIIRDPSLTPFVLASFLSIDNDHRCHIT